MARIDGRPSISCVVMMMLSEEEAAAMLAVTAYGADSFLKAFYSQLGRSELERHEGGLRSLFDGIRESDGIPLVLSRLRNARKVFSGEKEIK